jgi:thioredoxin 1
MGAITVTDESVNDILNNNEITVLDFSAEWCGPCRVLGPIVDELSDKRGDIMVGKVNVDENNKTALEFGIRSIPTIIFFKNGEKVNQISGVKTLVELENLIDKI